MSERFLFLFHLTYIPTHERDRIHGWIYTVPGVRPQYMHLAAKAVVIMVPGVRPQCELTVLRTVHMIDHHMESFVFPEPAGQTPLKKCYSKKLLKCR